MVNNLVDSSRNEKHQPNSNMKNLTEYQIFLKNLIEQADNPQENLAVRKATEALLQTMGITDNEGQFVRKGNAETNVVFDLFM